MYQIQVYVSDMDYPILYHKNQSSDIKIKLKFS